MNRLPQNNKHSGLAMALLGLAMNMKPANYPDGVTPKGRTDGAQKSSATRKKAEHIQGRHFLGRRIYQVTPAQYRHQHMGKSKKAK